MKCKNCGANVPNGSAICSNCGAVLNPNSDYVLLTNEAKTSINDEIKAKKKRKKRSAFSIILALILVVAAGFGSFYYFTNQNAQKPQPELDFFAGYGIINGDEPVVYVSIKDSAKVQYIQGVTCYNKKMYSLENDAMTISTDYKYTKNVDNSIRTIYFDMADLKVNEGKNYTYTFEMKYSFYDDENIYTYYQPVNFVGSTKNDVSEIVFDHTVEDTNKNDEHTTEVATKDERYIYDVYWYSNPVAENGNYSIFSYSFNRDNTVSYTYYSVKAGKPWTTVNNSATYKIKNDRIIIEFEEAAESFELIMDKENKALYDVDNETNNKSTQYTYRQYNSLEEARTFFGV